MERAVVPKPAVELQGGEAKGADQFSAGMRVLAVDDDRTCLKVLERLLVCCKYHVTGTTQAETALQMLREKPDGFDLVITDVVMPAIDGFKLLELVGLEMDLPVIMLSGSEDSGMVMKGIMHGACDYLLKPVRILELKNIWQHVVRRRLADQRRSGGNNCADSSVGSISSGDRRAQPLKIRDKAKANAQSGSAAIHGDKVDKKRSRSRGGQEEEEPEERSACRKPRFVWAPELHFKFVSAVNQLGIDKAIPRKIQEIMQVENVTREQIASHLQKFRLSLKKVNSARSPRLSIAESFIRRDNFRKYMKLLEGSMDYEPTGSYGNTTTHFEVMSSTTLTAAGAQGTLSSQDTQFADTMRKLTALVEWMNATRLSNGAHGPLSSQDSQFANTMSSLTSLVEQMNLKLAAEGAHGALSSSQSAPLGGALSNHTAFLGRRTNLTLMAGAANGMLPSQAGQFAGMSNNCAATFGWTNSTLVAAGAHGTLPSQTSQFAGASDDLTAIVVSLNSMLMSSEDHGTLPSQTSQFTGASNNLTGTWNNNLVMPFEWTNKTRMPAGAHGTLPSDISLIDHSAGAPNNLTAPFELTNSMLIPAGALGTLPSQPGQFAGTANNFSFLETMNPMLVPAGTHGDHGTLPPQLSQFGDASNHLIDPFNNLVNPQHGNLGGGVYGLGSMVSDPSPPLPPSLVQPPLQPVGFFPTGTPNNYAVNGFAPIAQDSFSPAISSIDFDNSTNVNPVGPPAEFNQPAAGDELQGLVNSFNRSINMHQAGIDESRPMRNFGAELDPMAIEEGGGPTGGMEGNANANANANAMCAPDDGTDIFMDWMQDYDLVNDDFDELGKLVGLGTMN